MFDWFIVDMFDGACSVQATQDELEESQTNESASFNQSVSTLDTSMNQVGTYFFIFKLIWVRYFCTDS